MLRSRWLLSSIFMILFFSISILAFAKTVEAANQRISIQVDFIGAEGSDKIVPEVNVHLIDLSTGEAKEETFLFNDQAFNLPQGFQVKNRWEVVQVKKDMVPEFFRMNYSSYTVNTTEGIMGYALYEGKSYKKKVVDEWMTLEEDGINRKRLYVFNYTTKELKLLKESTLYEKLRPITYSYHTDLKTKEKFKSMDPWDYINSGTSLDKLFINADLYSLSDNTSKTTVLYSLSKNTYVATVPFDPEGILSPKTLTLCSRNSRCFESNESTSFNDNVVFMKSGRYYEILKNHSIKEIKKTTYDWWQYQWRIVVNNHVFGERRINGWDYIISTDNNKVTKLSERYTFVREVTVSPDHKYLAIFEASYNKEKSKYEEDQVRIYDINKQKEVRVIKLPYREAPINIIWHSNTVLQYRPFSTNNPSYIRNVNVEILTGIITKDLPGGYEIENAYFIDVADRDNYFSFARPLEIRYQEKLIKYTKQPSFEGENGLVYCSLKDLANGLGADIKVESGAVKLTLNGKTATVDLKDKQVILYEGTAYAPIKSIILKLGLQYKRENLASQINLE